MSYYNGNRSRRNDIQMSRKQVLDLITMYRENECLWNVNSEIYKRNELKRTAWRKIADKLHISVDDIKRKIKSLRTVYLSEKKKVLKRKEAAATPRLVYEPSLFYYKELKFLDMSMAKKKTGSDHEENIALTQEESVRSCSTDITVERAKRKRRIRETRSIKSEAITGKFERAVDAIVNFATETPAPSTPDENVYSVFGKSIAIQLKQLPLEYAVQAMAEIQQLLTNRIVNSIKTNQRKTKPQNIVNAPLLLRSSSIRSDSELNYEMSRTPSPILTASTRREVHQEAVNSSSICD